MMGNVLKILFFSCSSSSFVAFVEEKRVKSSFLCLDFSVALSFLFSFSFRRSILLKMRIVFAFDLYVNSSAFFI